MTSVAAPSRHIERPNQSLVLWALLQVAKLIYGIFHVLIIGLVLAIARRRFNWLAYLAGTLFILAGVTATTMGIQVDPNRFGDNAVLLTWSAALLVIAIGGAVVARLAHTVGYWESYASSWTTGILFGVHLRVGFHHILARYTEQHPSYLDLVGAIPPGERLLGDLWPALLGSGAVIGFILMLFAGSLVFLVWGDDGVRDTSFSYELGISLRQLVHQRRGLVSVTALVAITGGAVCVAALVAVTAVMSGYQNDIQARILSTNAHLVVQKYGVDFTEYEKIAETVRTVPDVVATTPFVFNEASFSHGDKGLGVLLKGVVPETAGSVTDVTRNLCEHVDAGGCAPFATTDETNFIGMLRPDADRVPKLIVGIELYRKQQLQVGDLVTLTTPVSLSNVRGTAPKRMQFKVAGVFRSGMHEFDSRLTRI